MRTEPNWGLLNPLTALELHKAADCKKQYKKSKLSSYSNLNLLILQILNILMWKQTLWICLNLTNGNTSRCNCDKIIFSLIDLFPCFQKAITISSNVVFVRNDPKIFTLLSQSKRNQKILEKKKKKSCPKSLLILQILHISMLLFKYLLRQRVRTGATSYTVRANHQPFRHRCGELNRWASCLKLSYIKKQKDSHIFHHLQNNITDFSHSL